MGGLVKRAALLLIAVVCVYACRTDDDVPEQAGFNQAEVILMIRAGGDNSIADLHLLVFNDADNNGIYTFGYMANSLPVESDTDGMTMFKTSLSTSTVPLKLYVVANANDAFLNYSPAMGDTEADVTAALQILFTAGGNITYLPMSGQVALSSLSASTTTIITMNVLRAVARVDVLKDLIPSSPAFAMKELYIYRANDRIQLIPNALTDDGLKVTAPSVPANAEPLGGQPVQTVSTGTTAFDPVYIPEAVSYTGTDDKRAKATTIVVGGVPEGDTDMSYYRIDFNSGLEGHPFGQVLRNHLYRFEIKDVLSTGWPTPGEAADNLGSTLVVDVRQWEDFTTQLYFSDDFIGLSTRQVQMPFLPGYTRTVNVESSMPYTIQWLDATGEPTGNVVSDEDTPLANGRFTATIVREDGDAATVSHIRFASGEYNTTNNTYSQTLRLTVNGTMADIIVTKESPANYSGRVFQVMSTGVDHGSLGSYSTTGLYTAAMRQVLEKHFSPTSNYPFRIGGFFLLNVAVSGTSYTNATTAAAVANFKRMLQNVDVLLLSYGNVTSNEVAAMLLNEWLVEKPNRVLWVMRDTQTSNVNVIARTAADGEGEWANVQGFLAANGYRASGPADYAYDNATEVYEFFNGPFGTVTPNMVFYSGDAVAGVSYLQEANKRYVVPLVYDNNPSRPGYMIMGVNKRRGIVYMGESQIFQGGSALPMSVSAGNDGTIDTTVSGGKSSMDVLNANLWAWVVGRVIYGPP